MQSPDDTETPSRQIGAHRTPVRHEPRRLDVCSLLGDDREIVLVYRGADYRLRVTSNDKLILTK